jgi:hypothetical protein
MKLITIIQVSMFIIGAILMMIDGSGGYKENMTWVSYLGVSLCISGIGFTFIRYLIQLFK